MLLDRWGNELRYETGRESSLIKHRQTVYDPVFLIVGIVMWVILEMCTRTLLAFVYVTKIIQSGAGLLIIRVEFFLYI